MPGRDGIGSLPLWAQLIMGGVFCFPFGLILSPAVYLFVLSYLILANKEQPIDKQKPEKDVANQAIGSWLLLGVVISPILNVTLNSHVNNMLFPSSSETGEIEAPSGSYQDPSRTKLDAVLDGSDPMAEEKAKLLCLKYTNFDPDCGGLNRDGGKWNIR